MTSEAFKLTEVQFRKFRDFIYEKCGILFGDQKQYLLDGRLGERVRTLKLRNADEYFMFLRYDPRGRSELERLYEEITINETWFFRSQPQLDAFRDNILRDVMATRREQGTKTLRVWSAACSTGEEPYTLAILVRERLGLELPGWAITIHASDLSQKVLETARDAIYGEHSLRGVSEDRRARYFRTEDGKRFALRPEIRDMVTFTNANLLDDSGPLRFADMDVIFCRNVMIYFDDAARKKVLEGFYRSLRRGGYLVIGPLESLHGQTRAFEMVHFHHSVAFRKE